MRFTLPFVFTIIGLIVLPSSTIAGISNLSTTIRANDQEIEVTPSSTDCEVDLCFAVDGSLLIPSDQFKRQQNLVNRIVNSLPEQQKVGLAAVQFGLASVLISPFTEDRQEFRSQVRRSVQLQSPSTFLVAGINFCFAEIFERPIRERKILLLGTGIGDIGDDPVERARLFEKETGGAVFTISFGLEPNNTGLAAIAGDQENVFNGLGSLTTTANAIVSRLCT